MIDRRKKSHRAENLVSWPYSSKFTATTATHHTSMTYRIGGREEATDGMEAAATTAQKPAIMVGGCVFAS